MPQFGRPSADTSIGTYTDQVGGTTNIYTTIDETSPSDADYIRSVAAPANAPYVTKLSNVEDPVSSSGHVIRCRMAKDAAGGATINATVQLRQGYVSEGTPGTLIATIPNTSNISETFTDFTHTLSGAEADAISDYTSLFIRIVANQP